MLFGKVALVFGLQVDTVGYGVLEVLSALLKYADGLPVGDAGKVLARHRFEAVDKPRLNPAVKESEFLRAGGEHLVDAGADEVLGEIHEVREFAESELGLNHDKLGGMARRIGVLGAERGTERVDAAESHGQGFGFKLAGNSQVALMAEKVL